MNREEVEFLSQAINALEEAEPKLSEYYREKDSVNFNNMKKFMIDVQKKIHEVADGKKK